MRHVVPALVLFVLLVTAVGTPTARAEEETDEIVSIAVSEPLSLEAFLEAFAKAADLDLLWHPKDRSISSGALVASLDLTFPKARAVEVLRAMLVPHDLVLIPLGDGDPVRYWVANAHAGASILKLRPRFVEVTDENVDELEGQVGLYVTTTLKARHVPDLREARNAFARIVTGQNIGNVTEVPGARAFVVTDFAPNVAQIYRLLREMDVPGATAPAPATDDGTGIYVIALRHATAETVANVLVPLFGANRPWPWERQPQMGPATSDDGSGPRILADARLNQLVVRATPEVLERIEALVKTLDRAVPATEEAETVIQVIEVVHVHPREISNTLTGLVGRSQQTWRALGDGHLPVVTDTQRHVVVEATPRALEKLRRVIVELDQPAHDEEDDG